MWLGHRTILHERTQMPLAFLAIGLSVMLAVVLSVTLPAHSLLMTSTQAHASLAGLKDAPIAAGHAPAHATANPADLTIEFAAHPEDQPTSGDCGALTPWNTTGGSGGVERFDRPTPIIAASAVATNSWPMPDEPTHLYPPGVRRALLQVYRN